MSVLRVAPGMGTVRDAHVLVTGASSGIGAALAEELAIRGAHVALLARRRRELEEVAARCHVHGVDAHVVVADLGDAEQAATGGAAAWARLGHVDVLVNNAGRPLRRSATRLSPVDVADTMQVNFLGAVAVTLALLPRMLERGSGRIVNVGSVAGRVAAPREAAYVASKFALAGWSDTLAVDLAGSGVAVHHVSPGVIDTPLWDVPGQEPPSFTGRRVPASKVARAIIDAVEQGRYETFVPRSLAPVVALRGLMGEAYLKLTARFDRRRGGPAPGAAAR